jgi:tetratricopeptide (TPR) repeat protein
MGDFFSDARNGPLILLVILVVDIAVVMGGFFLVSRAYARRIIRRSLSIVERAKAGDVEGARSLAEAWDQGDRPRTPFARVNLAKVWAIIGDHRRVLSVIDGTKIPNSKACRPVRRAAAELKYEALRSLGEETRAEWFLRDAAEADPSAPWLATSRLKAALSEGDATAAGSAAADVSVMLRKRPQDPALLVILAQEALANHRFAEAADLLERLIARLDRPTRHPSVQDLYLALGVARQAAGRDTAAEQAFREVVERSSEREIAERKVMFSRAAGLLFVRRLDEAAAVYEALATDDEVGDAFAGLAMCRVRLGNPEGAGDALDRAETLGFDSSKARPVRAQILVDQGRGAEAEQLALDAAGDAATNDPGALYTLAYVRATAHLPDAEGTLRRYVDLQPNDPDLGPLLDRPAPGGLTWEERLKVAPRPDV